MVDPVADTWHTRDVHVLRAIVRTFDEGSHFVEPSQLAEATGMELEDVTKAVLALDRGAYIHAATEHLLSGGPDLLGVESITRDALTASGAWPSADNIADKLLAALKDLAEYSDDPVEKTRARKALEGLGGFSRDTLVAVIGASTGVALQ